MADRHRSRRQRLLAAASISSLGDGFVVVAFPLLAVHMTTNAFVISGLAFASRLPWLLLALPAGALVDRVDGRRVVLAVDLLRALVLAGVAAGIVTGHLSLIELYAAAFLVGAGETMVSTVMRAAVPLLAKGDGVTATYGQLSAAQTTGQQFAGPALGGVLFSLASSVPIVGDAVSYVLSALMLRASVPAKVTSVIVLEPTTLRADVRTGMRWFLGNRALRLLALVVTSFAFCQAMVLAVLVLYATRVLGLGDTGYGVFLAVAAVGDIVGSLLARRVHGRLGPWLTVVLAGAGAAAGYLILGNTSAVVVAVAALALEAASSSCGNVATISARQRLIPPERFGLIFNAFRMAVTGSIPIGALVGGILVTFVGLRPTFVIAGAVQLGAIAILAGPLRPLLAEGAVPTPVRVQAPEPSTAAVPTGTPAHLRAARTSGASNRAASAARSSS